MVSQGSDTCARVAKLRSNIMQKSASSARRRKARGAPLFSQENLDEINPSTELVAFDTLLQDESLSEDVRDIMRVKYE